MLITTMRDKNLFKFLDNYGAITTQQAKWIFFNGQQTSTIRRLNQLEKANILTSYHRDKHKVYTYQDVDRMSLHDLGPLDLYAWIYKQGGEVLDFKLKLQYYKGTLKPDALVKFRFPFEDKKYIIYAFLEYDLNHYTEIDKVKIWYEKMYKEKLMLNYCGEKAEFPLLIIARPTAGNRYNSSNFNVIYCDLHFTDLEKMLII